ncbi:Glycine/D-amino acid oxidase [Alkalibacterium putridalgicola]|uniref:Glycine/D-amino acid oxidase n=1 Tax=Alkalibacterium putridalgicola TaxID=426703 RepID=A0A1H7X884_9LACT|nr:FAD-dependent oxidoreductase [Alkalibacterium putridalgicola]GEK90083.1 oxidoreductase [Alkalibacterium putridalgicola]SEM29397.1 Glycine/D-amino acid oxidase [Alkalibacterium putridalgicola]
MKRKKVAVIGAGVVGASAAYILSKETDIDLTIYDEGIGQGTSAAAGIISPWLSKRRNKKWYNMVKAGAAFYPDFLSEVMDGEPVPSSVYKRVGTLLFKQKDKQLEELLEIGLKRREDAPEIGELTILPPQKIKEMIPIYTKNKSALYASGGARVDGEKLVELLLSKAVSNGAVLKRERVSVEQDGKMYAVVSESETEHVDAVILAVAAWLPELLEPLDYEVDIRPQKGQLVEVTFDGYDTQNWPVVMPEGEKDITPFENGTVVIGATHENDKGFDLEIERTALTSMIKEASETFSHYFSTSSITSYRSGTRAYTSDFSPFMGKVPELPNVVAASGLGSTGLTAGPLVGKCLADLVQHKEPLLSLEDYPIGKYIKKQD